MTAWFRMLTHLMIAVSLLTTALSASAAVTQTPSAAGKGGILILGDSISAGLGVTPERTWVRQFADLMQKKYRLQVVNASVSGETSGGGRHRLPALLSTHAPQFVLLELGGNDGLRGQSLAGLSANLQDMIRQSHAAGARVVLLGMRIPVSYGARYSEAFAAVYPALAAQNALPLVPFLLDKVALDPRLMQADKIHPNDQGQTLLLQNVMDVFEPILKQHKTVERSKR